MPRRGAPDISNRQHVTGVKPLHRDDPGDDAMAGAACAHAGVRAPAV